MGSHSSQSANSLFLWIISSLASSLWSIHSLRPSRTHYNETRRVHSSQMLHEWMNVFWQELKKRRAEKTNFRREKGCTSHLQSKTGRLWCCVWILNQAAQLLSRKFCFQGMHSFLKWSAVVVLTNWRRIEESPRLCFLWSRSRHPEIASIFLSLCTMFGPWKREGEQSNPRSERTALSLKTIRGWKRF